MYHVSILAVQNAENVFDRPALRVFDNGVVEFLAAGYVNHFRFHQGLLGQDADMGSDESDLDVRIAVFDGLSDADVARKSRRAREQYEEFVVLAGADRFFRCDVMWRGVQQARAPQPSGRIGAPNRIPVRFNFTPGGAARAGPPIANLKRKRIPEERFLE